MSLLHDVSSERKAQRDLDRKLEELGHSPAVERFLSRYGKIRTRTTHATMLAQYFRWLKEQPPWQGSISPDGLIKDNLICVFDSKAI
jgi:hypothetical protein